MTGNMNNIGAGISENSFYMPGMDTEVTQHSMDRVEERVRKYEARVQSLSKHLATVGEPVDDARISRLLQRIRDIIAPQGAVGRPELGMQRQHLRGAAWLVGNSIDSGSHRNRTLLSQQNGGMPQMIDQVAMHVSYHVRTLQIEYAGVEAEIARLEQTVRARNGGSLPAELGGTLAEAALKERHETLQRRIDSQNPTEKLRTVHTDGVRLQHIVQQGPGGAMIPVRTEGSVRSVLRYEVRLPADTGMTIIDGPRSIQGTEIPLSGGEKWVRFPTEVVNSVNVATARVLIHRPSQPDAVGTVGRTDHGNLIFSFGNVPPGPPQQQRTPEIQIGTPERDRTTEEPRKKKEEKEKKEKLRETPQIDVNRLPPFYTDGGGTFNIASTNPTETTEAAARATTVRFNNVTLALPGTPGGTHEHTNDKGIKVTRLANGQVMVRSTTGENQPHQARIEFQRGSQRISRLIRLNVVRVSPAGEQSVEKPLGTADEVVQHVNYAIRTSDFRDDQNNQTRVTVDGFDGIVPQGAPNTNIGDLNINRQGETVDVSPTSSSGRQYELHFRHGLQDIVRIINITSPLRNPTITPPVPPPPTRRPGQSIPPQGPSHTPPPPIPPAIGQPFPGTIPDGV